MKRTEKKIQCDTAKGEDLSKEVGFAFHFSLAIRNHSSSCSKTYLSPLLLEAALRFDAKCQGFQAAASVSYLLH